MPNRVRNALTRVTSAWSPTKTGVIHDLKMEDSYGNTQNKPRIQPGMSKVELAQVWRKKDNGLLVRVCALSFVEPKFVMWRAIGNYNTVGSHSETEFTRLHDYVPEITSYAWNPQTLHAADSAAYVPHTAITN